MGSCISKCKPKKTSKKQQLQKQDECKCQCIDKNNSITSIPLVEDKLVISQAPISSPPPPKTSLTTPSSPSTSSPSAKSSCTNSNYPTTSTSSSTSTSSCSMLSSASSFASSSSSVLSSKSDQSFSNDFLWSCVKENPQILNSDYLPIRCQNSGKKLANPRRNSLPTRCQNSGKKPNRYKEFPAPSPQRVVVRSAAQKRPRCNSPSNLTRQKSFRGEPEVESIRPISRSGRDLRPMSPSSTRRFYGEGNSNQGRSLTSSLRRDNSYVRPPSPSKGYNGNYSRRYGGSNNLLMKRENDEMIKRVSSKIEELGVGGLVSTQDMDLMPIEDVENPHIALDCFIFL